MTTIERFQRLQIELVRAGFQTELHAGPHNRRGDQGDTAEVMMYVDLHDQLGGGVAASGIERLGSLTAGHGFAYSVGDDSRATVNLAPEVTATAHRP